MREVLVYIASALVVTLVSWLSERLISFVNSKIKNQKVVMCVTAISNAVTNAVKATQQEFVDNLKKTGTFDEAAQKEALQMAKAKVLEVLTEETKKFIKDNYGDIDPWLATAIHSALYDLKK